MKRPTWAAYKKRKRLIAELRAVKARRDEILLKSEKAFYGVIGELAIVWAEIEVLFDACNMAIFRLDLQPEDEIPVSLNNKLSFFKRAHKAPQLASLAEEARAILSEANDLKQRRHDLVHGVAWKRLENGDRTVIRFLYAGPTVNQKQSTYSTNHFVSLGDRMGALGNRLARHWLALKDLIPKNHADDDAGSIPIAKT